MTIPNLPTDNLYKFIALSGVIIMIASVVLYLNQYNILRNDINELETEEIKTNHEITYGEEDSKNLSKKVFGLSERIEKIKNSKDEITIKQNTEELENELNRLTKITRSLKLNNELFGHKLKIAAKKNSTLFTITIFLSVFFLCGFFMAFGGFSKWYHFVQKISDEKIALELKELKKKLANS